MVVTTLKSQSNQDSQSGFSLVEVLTVVAILMLLAGISVVAFRGATNFSERRACEVDVTSTVSAITAYTNDWEPSGAVSKDFDLYVEDSSKDTALRYNNLVPKYMGPLAAAKTVSTSGRPYSIDAVVALDPTSGSTFTITVRDEPGQGRSASVTTSSPDAINTACKTVIQ